jgi:drug/metabolite transporter (DMT)-like permease
MPRWRGAPRLVRYACAIDRPSPHADHLTLLAFAGIVLCGGSNAVAIRLGNEELAPFWAATLRFGLAACVLLATFALLRLPLPRGRARIGILLYGLTAFAGAYAALYWGLVEAPAGSVQVIIATVPLVTLLLAVALRQERFTLRGIAGAVVAMAGIVVIVGDQLAAAVPLASLLAVLVGVCFIALGNVIVKQIPPGHPVTANAFGMGLGAAVLLGLAVVVDEPRVIPQSLGTWASLAYLVVVGSVGLFMLTLYVLARWSASATAYATLAMPVVTVVVAALVLGESVGPPFFVGAGLVLAGVYVGISASRSMGVTLSRSDATAGSGSGTRD